MVDERGVRALELQRLIAWVKETCSLGFGLGGCVFIDFDFGDDRRSRHDFMDVRYNTW